MTLVELLRPDLRVATANQQTALENADLADRAGQHTRPITPPIPLVTEAEYRTENPYARPR